MTTFAFGLVLLSALLHALWNVASRKLLGNLSVLTLGVAVSSLLAIPFVLYFGSAQDLNPEAIFYILATGVLQAAYVWLLGMAYRLEDVSFVYPISRGCGVVGTALSSYFLASEKMSLLGGIGIALVCLGTVFIGLKRSSRATNRAFLFSILSGMILVQVFFWGKRVVTVCHPVVYIAAMFAVTALTLFPWIYFYQREELSTVLRKYKKYSVLIGVGALSSYLLALFAFQLVSVAYVVAVREFSVVIGVALGIWLLKEPVSFRRIACAIAITAGSMLIKLG